VCSYPVKPNLFAPGGDCQGHANRGRFAILNFKSQITD
jgi:hypothetical protein